MNSSKTARQANMELLRCAAMMMVIVLHYLGKGGLLPDPAKNGMTAHGAAAWILEALCIVAVNLYMLLSGYFGWKSSFKLSKLIKLYLQIWFYSAVVGMAAFAIWGYPKDSSGLYFFLKLFFPVSMEHYWFMTAYVYLFLILPFVGTAVRKMEKNQMRAVILLLALFYCLLKSAVPVRFEMDKKGYDAAWYLCMFVVGAYLGKFKKDDAPDMRAKRKMRGLFWYLAGTAGVLAELFVLGRVYGATGKLGTISRVSIEYNQIFPVIAAIGLFVFFENCRVEGKIAGVIVKIAPYTLGVYLFHENMVLRYLWQNWFGAERVDSVLSLITGTLCAVCVVFTAGILLDLIRSAIEKGLHRLLLNISLYRILIGKIRKVDALFQGF